jgi:hypothetical protein
MIEYYVIAGDFHQAITVYTQLILDSFQAIFLSSDLNVDCKKAVQNFLCR